MALKIFPPASLRIFRDGISCLLDKDWLYSSLPYLTNMYISRGKLPKELFVRSIHDGFLYYPGTIFFDQQFNIEDDVLTCDAEYAQTESAMVFWLLNQSGLNDSQAMFDLMMTIDEIDEIVCEVPKKRQNSVLHKKGIHYQFQDALWEVQRFHDSEIKIIKDIYAKNFAERVLHDRQICEYIAFSLCNIYGDEGYPFLGEDKQLTFVKIQREKWPAWVRPTLFARERGFCANCGVSFSELQGEPNIDHIVPLSKGGCNDLVNLQLLCSTCNDEKYNKSQLVNSSIPKYFDWYRSKKPRKLTQS